MTTTLTLTKDGHLDALAMARAYIARDADGLAVIAAHCDPGATLAALLGYSNVWLCMAQGTNRLDWLAYMTDNVDDLMADLLAADGQRD